MVKSKNIFSAIGLMSGTSLDGVDLAYCLFEKTGEQWRYRIKKAVTIPYSIAWKKRLTGSPELPGYDLQILHKRYGNYLGGFVKSFIGRHRLKVDFVASHGHTIFHRPEKGITFQLGDGAAIAAACSHPVVSDFRSADVALGGQGAPLVPAGDEMLFPGYDFCLNLGGFANISYRYRGKRIAFDICPCNILQNRLSSGMGKEYDADGKIARRGKIDEKSLKKLNNIKYYRLSPPKSLGRECAEKNIFPLFDNNRCSIPDKLRTAVEHIAWQVSRSVNKAIKTGRTKILVTGGGAHNTFLMERLKSLCDSKIYVPSKMIVDFKEALIFAFLGALRWRGEINCLKSVTGAKRDSCCGAVYFASV